MSYSVRAMADQLGVSKSQVARDKAAGMPMHDVAAARAWREAQHDLSRTVDGRIDRPASDSSARAAGGLASAAGAGGADAVPPASAGADDGEPASEDTAKFRQARADREATNAERARIELEQLRGNLISLVEAQRLAFTAFRSLRDAVLNVPARVRDQLAIETDAAAIEQLLEAELSAALSSLNPDKVLTESDDEDDDETG